MASTALASPALARDGQWYIEGQGGPMIVEDLDFDIVDADGDVVDTAGADTDTGYDFGGVVGYDFGAFRLEADASYRQASIDRVTAAGEQYEAGGDASALSFMLNGLLDFGEDDGLQGFVGGGAGVVTSCADGGGSAEAANICDQFPELTPSKSGSMVAYGCSAARPQTAESAASAISLSASHLPGRGAQPHFDLGRRLSCNSPTSWSCAGPQRCCAPRHHSTVSSSCCQSSSQHPRFSRRLLGRRCAFAEFT